LAAVAGQVAGGGSRRPNWLRVASFAALLLVWQLASMLARTDTLPPPLEVLERLWAEVVSGVLPWHLAITLYRVALSFIIAMLIGTAIGVLMGRSRRFDAATDGLLVIGLNTPALIVIILCYIWLGLTELAAILAVVVNKVPTVTVTVREGARAIDRRLLQVAEAYRLPAWRTAVHVYLPQLQPYLIAAARSGLSLIWKIVLVVELLGRSSGMGFQLATFFQFFDITGILAYTAAFIAVVMVVEALVMRPLDRNAARWQA
jgi:NitT/TauT family transport system permease protein